MRKIILITATLLFLFSAPSLAVNLTHVEGEANAGRNDVQIYKGLPPSSASTGSANNLFRGRYNGDDPSLADGSSYITVTYSELSNINLSIAPAPPVLGQTYNEATAGVTGNPINASFTGATTNLLDITATTQALTAANRGQVGDTNYAVTTSNTTVNISGQRNSQGTIQLNGFQVINTAQAYENTDPADGVLRSIYASGGLSGNLTGHDPSLATTNTLNSNLAGNTRAYTISISPSASGLSLASGTADSNNDIGLAAGVSKTLTLRGGSFVNITTTPQAGPVAATQTIQVESAMQSQINTNP